MSPHLSRIQIFPVKSLDGQDLEEAVVLRGGGLQHDREYCLLDDEGQVLNTKRLGEKLVPIRSEVHLGFGEISLCLNGESVTYHLERQTDRIEEWLSACLGQRVHLAHDAERGFPDDPDAPGPTVVAVETLREVGSWFGLTVPEVRRRFRANLEIDGVPAFWEDRLYGPPEQSVTFRIGDVAIEGVNPCARCAVPSRDSYTGQIEVADFAKTFAERRKETLPEWAAASRFDHFYRLAVNTKIPGSEAGKILEVSDDVCL
jgi:hypothetical protein